MKQNTQLLSERLTETISHRYTTQTEIAKYAGITTGMMSHYCNGNRMPSTPTLIKICIGLDCSPDWITKGKGSIEDKFDFSRIDKSRTARKISATRIDELVEIRFFINQKDFSTFFQEAKRDGCLS